MQNTKPKLLNVNEIVLSEIPGWSISTDQLALKKKFQFKTFEQAFQFMSNCCEPIQKMDHHPEWSNTYNTVNVQLSTHDSGGITHRDINLAKEMDRVLKDLIQ